jgi:hypothetical protein
MEDASETSLRKGGYRFAPDGVLSFRGVMRMRGRSSPHKLRGAGVDVSRLKRFGNRLVLRVGHECEHELELAPSMLESE